MKATQILRLIALVVFVVSVSDRGISQTGVTPSDHLLISSLVNSLFGPIYKVQGIINVDSAIGNPRVALGAITDPFGTLRHCFIFTAKGWSVNDGFTPKGFIGIFRSGQIIWHSDTLIANEVVGGGGIVEASDLNNDGEVDIVTSWKAGAKQQIEYYWIISWNGQIGRVITLYDQQNESVVVAESWTFEFVDTNGDGVMEIVGDWYPTPQSRTKESIVYSWNGVAYGKWGASPSLPSGFLPRDKANVKVSSRVRQSGSAFAYTYVIENMQSSLQSLDEFLFVCRSQTQDVRGRAEWKFSHKLRSIAGWWNLFVSPNLIKKGEADSSFQYQSVGLPSIAFYFVRGNNPSLKIPSYDENLWYQDLQDNSVRGAMVAAADPDSPFVALNFTDTLSSYVTRSLTLNWITTQSTADKYAGLFSRARSDLQQNNTNAVRARLDTVLQQIPIDSVADLTSEAYALLKFNTEYLLSQLPATVGPSIALLTPGMTLTDVGAFTLTVQGSGFTNGSVVMWNGSARTTTFVSSTELRGEIPASDVASVGSPAITVSNPDGSVSGALGFRVVSALPQTVHPRFNCITRNPDGTLLAWFGYDNLNATSVLIPVTPSRNKFTPAPQDRGQTTIFLPGLHERVFSVEVKNQVKWHLLDEQATGSRNSAQCP